MVLRQKLKEGLIIITIYILITLCLFMAAERIERLENHPAYNAFVTLKISK